MTVPTLVHVTEPPVGKISVPDADRKQLFALFLFGDGEWKPCLCVFNLMLRGVGVQMQLL